MHLLLLALIFIVVRLVLFHYEFVSKDFLLGRRRLGS
jgi:hypothetical protein